MLTESSQYAPSLLSTGQTLSMGCENRRNISATTLKAYATLLVVYLVWGTTVGAIHIGVETFPAEVLVCLRFLLAGLLIFVICALRKEPFPGLQSIRRNLLIGFMLFVAGNSLVSWAVQHVGTGIGTTLMAITPFWMVGLTIVIPPREKINRAVLLGLFIGFFGILILLSPQLLKPRLIAPEFWGGVLLFLMSSFFWALGSVISRKKPPGSSLLMNAGIQNFCAGLFFLPMSLWTVHAHAITPSLPSIAALIYLILLGSVFTLPCYFYMLKHLPIQISSTFSYVNPVVAILFGNLILNETVNMTTILGAVVILSGLFIVQRMTQAQQKLGK